MRLRITIVLSAVAFILTAPVRASIYTWNDTNGNWAANDNWAGGVAPTGDANTVLVFGSTAGQVYTATNDIPGSFFLNQLVFTNVLGSAETIAGGQLDFVGTTPKVIHNGNSSMLVFNDVFLNSGIEFAGTAAATLQMRGAIFDEGGAALTKNSTGILELRGANSYSGGTVVNSGILLVNNSGAGTSGTGSGSVTINSGATVRVVGTITGAVDVNKDGTIKGNGTVGNLTIERGGILSPGNSPGTLHAGDTIWNAGGIYLWEIDQFNGGTAGADPGWDLLDVNGALTIAANPADKFIIDITSIAPGSDGFNKFNNYSMLIATASGGISGFAPTDFFLDTSDFTHPFQGYGFWTISQSGNSLLLSYTAVPEPSVVLLWSVGLGMICVPYLRRRLRDRAAAC